MKQDIVLMAKSKKGDEGYCVAGIDTNTGKWIRLNMRNKYSIPRSLFKYSDGSEPELLDVLSIEVKGKDNELEFQPENHFCDISSLTKVERNGTDAVLKRLNDDGRYEEVLYDNLPYIEASMLKSFQGDYYSLMIIEPEDFHYFKQREGKINAYFRYKGNDYKAFRITDLDFVESCKNDAMGRYHYPKKDYLLVVSMGVPFVNYHSGAEECWKLVAAVIDKSTIKTQKQEIIDEKTQANQNKDVLSSDLYRHLTNLRLSIAQREGLPAYCIFQNKTLIEMCEKLPEDESELCKIFGVGERRAAKYGSAFLKIIREYIQDNDIIKVEEDNSPISSDIVELLEAIEGGINPMTGEMFDNEDLIQDEAFNSAIKRLYRRYIQIPKTKELTMAGQAWDAAEDETLRNEFNEGKSIKEIAELHGRTRGAITARLKKKGLIE